MKNALIIIDFQNGFLEQRNSWFVPGASKIIPQIKKLCEACVPEERLFVRFVNRNLRYSKACDSKFLPGSLESKLHKSVIRYANKKNTFEKNGYSVFQDLKLLRQIKKNHIEINQSIC